MTHEDFPYYFICRKCAKKKGGRWPKGHCATVSLVVCKYCKGKNHKKDEYIAPYVDYDWKKMDTRRLRD